MEYGALVPRSAQSSRVSECWRLALAAGLWVLAGACSAVSPAARQQTAGRGLAAAEPRAESGHLVTSASAAPVAASPVKPDGSASVQPSSTGPQSESCAVPSLSVLAPRDERDDAALAHCRFRRTGHEDLGQSCGQPAKNHPVDLATLDAAVLPFDEATRAKLRSLAELGQQRGRRLQVFGLLGDSITFSDWFLKPFASGARYQLSPEVRQRLRIRPGGSTIIDYYRGVDAQAGLDSFAAPRAAKNGARSSWALPLGQAASSSPVGQLVRSLSPAVVIVMYGSNDATVRFTTTERLRADFRERMVRIVDYLESEGVIPVLNTVLRHGHDPSRSDCDRGAGDLSNWRVAVQSSVVSAVAAELACERKLPLIDLRHGMDQLLNSGLGADGIHPDAFLGGAGSLTGAGLQCGFNLRNYLTLRMLEQIHQVVGGSP